MHATPFSKEPYFPMLLTNGQDGLVLDYTGNGYGVQSSHVHAEMNQGVTCGWYKASSRYPGGNTIQPLFTFGFQLNLFGGAAEPRSYDQYFIPEKAMLITDLQFYRNIRIRMTGFLTDDGLFVQQVSLLENPDGHDVDFSFGLNEVCSSIPCLTFRTENAFGSEYREGMHRFTYRCGEILGQGAMQASLPYDDVTERYGTYRKIPVGFTVWRWVAAADTTEGNAGELMASRIRIAASGYDALLEKHTAIWNAYFSTSSVHLPDEKLEYLYRLSRYVLRGAQHPKSGAIGLGLLPNLWGGGMYDTYDEMCAHAALLTSGNLEEGRRFLDSYVDHRDFGKKILSERGVAGTAYAGWDDYAGRFLHTTRSFFEYTMEYKPCFTAFMIYAAYYQARFDPDSFTEAVRDTVRDCVAFLMDVLIRKRGDHYCLIPVSAGNESDFIVEVDSFNQLVTARGLTMAGELLDEPEWKAIGEDLMDGLSVNLNEDGYLLGFRGAPYVDGINLLLYWLSLPDPIDIKHMEAALEAGRRPYGINSENVLEEYRHWPWNVSQPMIAYIHEGQPEKAMEMMLHLADDCTALGALPEKIRIDGYAIGYWYTSSHAFALWAINEAMAFADPEGKIWIACGYDQNWGRVEARTIPVLPGIKVSFISDHGKLLSLELINETAEERALRYEFMADGAEHVIVVPAGSRIEIKG